MPRLDKTGPLSEGPMTGRGLGNCNPNNNKNIRLGSKLNNQNARKKPLYGRGLGLGNRRNLNNRGR
ncbi:MAG: DUF5320 domain-containing protein [Bacilli bacterium]|nr:DUF5320 domain-containing protein [Bacilli bacterium]MDD4298651.1 DUF5320 domain-containing protein [Bacilli bacterium]MDD4644005.1 DUF5320 domain-containing protein [Bacilli bacterium]